MLGDTSKPLFSKLRRGEDRHSTFPNPEVLRLEDSNHTRRMFPALRVRAQRWQDLRYGYLGYSGSGKIPIIAHRILQELRWYCHGF